MTNNNFKILHDKLTEFRLKYYKNEILKGFLFSVIFFLSYFLIIAFSEYFLWLSPVYKTIIFFLSIVLFVVIVIKYIIISLFHYFNIGNVIDNRDASFIISKHFPEIQDKLLNTLELVETNDNNNSLIIASIEQRISNLKPVPFSLAIDFRLNYKYLKYLTLLIFIILAVYFINPSIIGDSSKRIISYNTEFVKTPPFSFKLLTKKLEIRKGSDITIEVEIWGDYVPNFIDLVIGNNTFLMKKSNVRTFSYTLKNVNNDLNFRFSGDTYFSNIYNINVLDVPKILSFTLSADIPSYTSVKSFEQVNVGDIVVPQGTILQWKINSINSDSIYFISDSISTALLTKDDSYIFTQKALNSYTYSLKAINKNFKDETFMSYNVSVVPDIYPEISVEAKPDENNIFISYFKGNISDDYGFTKLNFVFNNVKTNLKEVLPVEINKNINTQLFYYVVDFTDFNAGDEFEYYFEIWDNDILGFKSSNSEIYSFKLPDNKEIDSLINETNKNLDSDIKKGMDLASDISKEFNNLKKKLLDDKISNFEKKELMNQISEKHNELKDLLNKLTDEQKSNNDIVEKLTEQRPEILEKQKMLEDLLEKIMDPELEKLLEEFNKLKENFKKDDFFELSEQMQMNYDDLEKQLDKNLELFKKFEVEQKIDKSINDLKNLAEEQKKLSESKNLEDLKQNQNEIKDKLSQIKENYKDALEKNEALENKMNLENFEKDFENIEKSNESISEQLQQGKQNKSKSEMQKSSDQMQQLAQKMDSMMQQQQQQQSMEDMNALRQILDNLLTFSFDQENLLNKTKKVDCRDPQYISLSVEQNLLRENFQIVQDSLYALAKRNPQINTTVTKELLSIQSDMSKVISGLEQLQSSNAKIKQQYIITSVNNLALLLDEILQSMQQSAANQMSGQQQCQNPNGNGKGQSLSQMKSQQQSVKSQLQQMIDQMKKGSQDGKGQQGVSKQLSKMLSEQEQQRQMLQDLMKSNSFSPEAVKQLKEIDKMMQQNENDIINKNISSQTMFRQNQIMSRLLEAENAERQREYDKKRESNEAEEKYSNPKEKFEYKESDKKFEKEQIEYSNLKMSNFYRKKYNEYIINITNK